MGHFITVCNIKELKNLSIKQDYATEISKSSSEAATETGLR
jgi:hypothetical protein